MSITKSKDSRNELKKLGLYNLVYQTKTANNKEKKSKEKTMRVNYEIISRDKIH